MVGYKILTHDYRSPIQGGEPIWGGVTLPSALPAVRLDTGPGECAAGWNFCLSLVEAFRIAGWWPMGRPAVAVVVEGGPETIQRGTKCRASTLTILTRVGEPDILAALDEFSLVFAPHARAMAEEQARWRRTLARTLRAPSAQIEAWLREALEVRGLSRWSLQAYPSTAAAVSAVSAVSDRAARAARAAWATWEAWDTRAAWATWEASDTRAAWAAWAAWATWEAWDARAAWDAWAALVLYYMAINHWIPARPDLLSVGLRDAYEHGVELVLPTGKEELIYVLAATESPAGQGRSVGNGRTR